jgi:hypothetical protein
VAELLDRYIDPRGSVVVGFATFKRGVNKKIQTGTATAAKSRLAVPSQNGTIVRLFPP